MMAPAETGEDAGKFRLRVLAAENFQRLDFLADYCVKVAANREFYDNLEHRVVQPRGFDGDENAEFAKFRDAGIPVYTSIGHATQ